MLSLQGFVIFTLNHQSGLLEEATIDINMERACLELCNLTSRSQAQPIATLEAALACLAEQPKPSDNGSRKRYDVHADVASGAPDLASGYSPAESSMPVPEAAEQQHMQQQTLQQAQPAVSSLQSGAQQRADMGHSRAAARGSADNQRELARAEDPRIAAVLRRVRGDEGEEAQTAALLELLEAELRGPRDCCDDWIAHNLLGVGFALLPD